MSNRPSDCAEVIEQAMSLFGEEYPRDQGPRLEALDQELDRKTFRLFDDRFFVLLKLEKDRFEHAADDCARNVADRETTPT